MINGAESENVNFITTPGMFFRTFRIELFHEIVSFGMASPPITGASDFSVRKSYLNQKTAYYPVQTSSWTDN